MQKDQRGDNSDYQCRVTLDRRLEPCMLQVVTFEGGDGFFGKGKGSQVPTSFKARIALTITNLIE